MEINTLPLHERAALGTATCWAMTGLMAADAVRDHPELKLTATKEMMV